MYISGSTFDKAIEKKVNYGYWSPDLAKAYYSGKYFADSAEVVAGSYETALGLHGMKQGTRLLVVPNGYVILAGAAVDAGSLLAMGHGTIVTTTSIYNQNRDLDRYRYYSKQSGNSVRNEGTSSTVSNKVDGLAKDMKDWLGKDAKAITNASGDKVFISSDGTRRIRFDINNTSPHSNPHGHVEQLVNGKWQRSGPIYPIDVPNN